MKKWIPLLSCFSLMSFMVQAQQTVTGLATPESVIPYKDGYFVSGVGNKLDATTKDGDGAIAWVRGGRVQSLKYFNDTLHAPKGLEILGNVLYVADIDHLKGYDLSSRKKVFDLNLEGNAGLLNDVSRVNDSLLVVTDSFKGDVLLVNTHTATSTILPGNIVVPNGVLYDAHTDEIYVCAMGANMDGTGKLYSKKLGDATDSFKPLEGTPQGLFDGIVQLDDTHLLLSDWITVNHPQTGNLYVYDIANKKYRAVKVGHSPADIALDKKKHQLLIPVMLDNKLEIWPLKDLGM